MKKITLTLILILGIGIANAINVQDSIEVEDRVIIVHTQCDTVESCDSSTQATVVYTDPQDVELSKTRVYKYREGTLTITDSDTTFSHNTTTDLIAFVRTGQDAIDEALKYRVLPDSKRWRSSEGHWAGVSLMYNSYSLPKDLSWGKQSAASIGANFNFADYVIYGRGNFGIVTGFGLQVNSLRFADPISFTNDPLTGEIVVNNDKFSDPQSGWKQTKLTTAYFQVPLLFEFWFSKYVDAWVNIGVVGSWCYESFFLEQSSEYGKQRKWRGANVEQLRYGFEMNVGVGSTFALKAQYYPESIFQDGLGPNITQFNVGLSLMF